MLLFCMFRLLIRYCLCISLINACCPLWVPSKTAFTVMPAFVLVQLPVFLSIILTLSTFCNCPDAVQGYGLIGTAISTSCCQNAIKNRETNLTYQLFPCFISTILNFCSALFCLKLYKRFYFFRAKTYIGNLLNLLFPSCFDKNTIQNSSCTCFYQHFIHKITNIFLHIHNHYIIPHYIY